MKRINIKTIIIASFFATNLLSQSGVTNLDFETLTSNSITNMCGATGGGSVMPTGFSGQVSKSNGPINFNNYTLTPIAQSGNNYVTVSNYLSTCGMIDLGNKTGIVNPAASGWGAPYNLKPNSFCGYYRTQGLTAIDSAFIVVYLSKNGTNIGYGKFIITSNQSNWTNFCANITYSSVAMPDTIKIRCTAGKLFSGISNGNAGYGLTSILDIDNCSLNFATTSITNNTNLLNGLQISPNPNQGIFEISSENLQPYNYLIYNELGKLVLQGNGIGVTKINSTQLAQGVYTIKVNTSSQQTCKKFILTN